MRDITRRLQRHRLRRYAAPDDPIRRRLPWIWIVVAVWGLWVAVISDHSLYRIWKLDREQRQAVRDLARLKVEIARLEGEQHDPKALRRRAETTLRERDGMAQPGEIIYRIQDGRPDTVIRH